ncbi:MAG: MMPL family transporter, partial [Gammaproteobacteria bacterium]|nr:MMPL family transporter [Gammaproteobacteria bacterium]
ASQIRHLTIDTSTESFLHKNDPTLLEYNRFRDQFGRDELIIVALQADDVFSEKFLRYLQGLHEALQSNVPHLAEITSLINARLTRSENDVLVVGELLEDWPVDARAMEKVKTLAEAHPLYRNLLLSEDGLFTTILIKTRSHSGSTPSDDLEALMASFEEGNNEPDQQVQGGNYLTDEENTEVVRAVEQVIEKWRTPGYPVYLTGSPVVTDVIKHSMLADMRVFLLLAVLTISLVLYALFRRLTGVVLPLLIVILSLLSTLGLMGALGVSFKVPSSILPSFLLALGVGASVHLLAIFYRHLHDNEDRKSAIVYALGHSGLAITMTSLTTAAGLFSFANAELAPVAELGQFAAAGALMSLVFTLVLLPAVLSRINITRRSGSAEASRHAYMDRLLSIIARFSGRRAWWIIGCAMILTLAALISSFQLHFSHNVLNWLPDSRGVPQATRLVDLHMKGTVTMEVVIDTGKENGLYQSDLLKRLDAFSREMEAVQEGELYVGKSVSIADVIKEIHQALNNNQSAYYIIPDDDLLVAQELFLFENTGSDDLEDFTDSRFSTARITSKVPWLDAVAYGGFLSETEKKATKMFPDAGQVTVTGLLPLLIRTIVAAIHSMATSYLIAAGVITLLMMMLINRIRMGLISMVPNLSPIIVTMGFMHWAGIPLDMFTMLMGSIAIGLAVDDTIHFIHNFQRYADGGMSVSDAIEKTLLTTGRAMLVTSVVLSLGFFVFMLAAMNNLVHFGLLTGIAIVLALLADFLLAPALVTVFYRPLAVPVPGKTDSEEEEQ